MHHLNLVLQTPEAGKKTVCVWAWPTELTTICNENGTSGPYKDFAGWVKDKNNNTDWYKNKDYHADAATVDNLFLSVSNMTQAEINGNSGNGGNNGGNNQKQASNLSVQNGSTTKDTGINLKSCVTTSSTGNITYKVYNGDFLVETQTKAYNESCTFTPTAEGTYTIQVSQAADNNYYASDVKTCTVTVNAAGSSEYLSETRTNQYNMTVTNNGDGTFNIAYNNKIIKSNATTLTLTWEENYTIEYDYEEGTGTPIPKEVVHDIRLSNNQKGDDLKGRNGSTTITLSDWDPGWGNTFSLILSATENNEWKLKVE